MVYPTMDNYIHASRGGNQFLEFLHGIVRIHRMKLAQGDGILAGKEVAIPR